MQTKDQKAYLMTGAFSANVVGSMINNIKCFPWMHQENDISTCAHVALWATLRYFGNIQSNYADITMGEICDKIQFHLDRKTPCRGLSTRQISNLLMQYNFSTLIRDKKSSSNARQYLNEILSYIESGLPLIGISSKSEHAICIVGHGAISLEFDDDRLCDFSEIYIEKLIIFLEVLICRYSLYLQAFAAFFITEDVLKCSHFPSCFPGQK
ncbi:MAG: hypothetical protein ACLUV3_09485 [Oscillospiraceae bacterium]|jgi:hypothetical protein